MAFLISIAPKMLGAMLFAILSYRLGSAAKRVKRSSSSDVTGGCVPT